MDEKEVTTQPMKFCNLFVEAMEQLNYMHVVLMWGATKGDERQPVIHTGSKMNVSNPIIWGQLYYEATSDFILANKRQGDDIAQYREERN